MRRLWWLNLIRGIVALIVGMLILTPEMTREQSFGRLLLGLFEVGLGVLLIILDALGPVSKLLAGGWAFIRRDSAHPPGFPDTKSTQGKTCGLTENREQFSYQAKQL